MKLYLVRHGEAVSTLQDPECPLSKHGEIEVKAIANSLATSKAINSTIIYHSVKKRAEQTARIIAETLGEEDKLQEIENLKPNDDPNILAEQIKTWQDDTMLVGHLPYMSKMLSLLVFGDDNKSYQELVKFSTGACVCLEKNSLGSWIINWMMDYSLAS